jgi:hypothetical protein
MLLQLHRWKTNINIERMGKIAKTMNFWGKSVRNLVLFTQEKNDLPKRENRLTS